jgi:plastocyanin
VSSALKTTGGHVRTFETPGTYRYRCTAHSESFTQGMVGIVVVAPEPIDPADAAVLEIVSGDDQVAAVFVTLAPFMVHVADVHGNSVENVPIVWTLETDEGPMVLGQTYTVGNFELRPVAYYAHTLGSAEGEQVISAAVADRPDIAPVHFSFTALPPPEALVEVRDWDDSWYGYCWYGGCGFSPSQVTVGLGKTVTWTWRGTQQHNVVFEDAPVVPISSELKTTGSHARTFDVPGTYRYRCLIHSTSYEAGMVGTIVVTP